MTLRHESTPLSYTNATLVAVVTFNAYTTALQLLEYERQRGSDGLGDVSLPFVVHIGKVPDAIGVHVRVDGTDIDLRHIGTKGTAKAKFSLAVPDKVEPKNKEKTYWAYCVAWGKLAEIIQEYLGKGQEVLLEGRMTRSSWEKDGRKHSIDEFVVESMEFCGGPREPKPKEEDPDIPF